MNQKTAPIATAQTGDFVLVVTWGDAPVAAKVTKASPKYLTVDGYGKFFRAAGFTNAAGAAVNQISKYSVEDKA